MRKNSICIDFVHKITFWSHCRSDVHTCTKSYVTSEPYPRASQIWCQNVRETRKKKCIKCRGESFARRRVIARNVEGGLKGPPVFLRLSEVPFNRWKVLPYYRHSPCVQTVPRIAGAVRRDLIFFTTDRPHTYRLPTFRGGNRRRIGMGLCYGHHTRRCNGAPCLQ